MLRGLASLGISFHRKCGVCVQLINKDLSRFADFSSRSSLTFTGNVVCRFNQLSPETRCLYREGKNLKWDYLSPMSGESES